MDVTTTLTTTHSIVLVQLSSGNVAMVEYQLSVGDLLIGTLLLVLVVLQLMQMWRFRR
jgi:uncharacterized protein (DUF486 family)